MSPNSGGVAVRFINGVGQQGFTGEVLPDSLRVQIVDAEGRAASEKRPIRFSVSGGGGSVSDTVAVSRDDGTAAIAWRLGDSPVEQRLTASLADLPSSANTSISAQAVPPSDADFVVVRGRARGAAFVVVRENFSTWNYQLLWPDTLLRLLPHGPANAGIGGTPSWQEVTVFTDDNPPETVVSPWTPGPDTVRLSLRTPIAVPFRVWISRDFDTTAVRARYDLTNLDGFWRTHRTGLRVGSIRVDSAPQLSGTIAKCSDVAGPIDPHAINVYYVSSMVEDNRPAVDCGPNVILMGMNTVWSFSDIYVNLLAHEMGHALSLSHVGNDNNVMSGSPVIGNELTAGQIYWIHFDNAGGLNSALGIHPTGERNCTLQFSSYCPAQTFSVW